MTMPTTNQELGVAFIAALKTDGATDAEAATTAEQLAAKMREHGVRNPRRLAECVDTLGLTTGDRLVLREVLGLGNGVVAASQSPLPAVMPPQPSGPQSITVTLDKTPRELRDGDLVALFGRDKSQDVVTAMRERFGTEPCLVMDGARVDVAATMQRLEDDDQSDVFESKVVATISEALDREYMADPLEGPAAKLTRRKLDGKDTWRAADGVHFPDADEPRIFAIWSRRAGHAWAQPGQPTQTRHAVAEHLSGYPDKLPSYMADSRVRFAAAKTKRDPSYSAADAESRYQARKVGGDLFATTQPSPGVLRNNGRAAEPSQLGRARGVLGDTGDRASTRAELRRAIDVLTDADFSRLTLDFFPHVHTRYSRGMDKTERATLLFSYVADADVERAIRNIA